MTPNDFHHVSLLPNHTPKCISELLRVTFTNSFWSSNNAFIDWPLYVFLSPLIRSPRLLPVAGSIPPSSRPSTHLHFRRVRSYTFIIAWALATAWWFHRMNKALSRFDGQ